jgi:hypothetical protein
MAVDFELTTDDLRVVTRYVAITADEVLEVYETRHPGDHRPHAAITAAWHFVEGAARSRLQRTASMEAHRAAGEATDEVARLAAQAAGDAASAAYLHPIARAHQVGHILRAAANAARIGEITTGSADAALVRAQERATPALIDILCLYPPATAGRSRPAQLMAALDANLRCYRSSAS